jgi:hypothetical protein
MSGVGQYNLCAAINIHLHLFIIYFSIVSTLLESTVILPQIRRYYRLFTDLGGRIRCRRRYLSLPEKTLSSFYKDQTAAAISPLIAFGFCWVPLCSVLEFLNNLWGPGTE